MKRTAFHELFHTSGPVVLPVIHVTDAEQTERNMRVCLDGGVGGVFLINHDFGPDRFLPIIRHARGAFPAAWIGVNFLAVTGRDAFPVLSQLSDEGVRVDAYWADDARIDERVGEGEQYEADEIDMVRDAGSWRGIYFGGTAFKKQRPVDVAHYGTAARLACAHMDVVTTSGVATGKAVDLAKVAAFRAACGETALAIASGVTPENAADYGRDVDCFMVATGINRDGDFYNVDAGRLARLMDITREMGDD